MKVYSRNFKASKRRENLTDNEHQLNKRNIKSTFGRNTEYWVTSNTELIHERKIIYDKLMLICDDDFGNIDKRRKAWHVTIKLSANDVLSYVEKCKQFAKM